MHCGILREADVVTSALWDMEMVWSVVYNGIWKGKGALWDIERRGCS